MRALFIKKIAALGFPAEEFGLHSMRSGGTTASANAKVPDRIFKRHGQCKSENAKDGYVKNSVKSRLAVSRNIRLYLVLMQCSLWLCAYCQPTAVVA